MFLIVAIVKIYNTAKESFTYLVGIKVNRNAFQTYYFHNWWPWALINYSTILYNWIFSHVNFCEMPLSLIFTVHSFFAMLQSKVSIVHCYTENSRL